MNTKLNRSDWIILAIIFGVTTLLNGIDYYKEDNVLIEYLFDFPTNIILSIFAILIFIQVLVPKFLIEKKNYVAFFLFGIVVLTLAGTIENIVGIYTGGGNLSGIKSSIQFLQRGLYNGSDMVGLPLGVLLIKKFYESQVKITTIEKQRKENELKLLRSQIDPHFLFNNLNTLDSLIDSNTEKAKEYINRLSLIYRYLIQTKDAEVMELSKEIELAENYMFLIKTRFENDYDFDIDINTQIEDKFIPTGALQTLLENVVKHNKPQNGNAIKTDIIVEDDVLKVINTKSNINPKNESFGTGLDNLKTRYQLLSDKEVIVINTDKEYNISIPIIKLIE